MAGDLQLRGPLRKPRELEVVGNLNDFFADVENIKIRNNGPMSFAISNQFLKIQQFHLIGEGTDLSVGGSVQLNGERELELRAQGHASLQLIQNYDSDFTTSGEVAVDLTVGGTISKPTTQGRLQITNGSIAYSDLPSALSAINGSAVFNQDRLANRNSDGARRRRHRHFWRLRHCVQPSAQFQSDAANPGRAFALSAGRKFHGEC